jgi:hypothetical protein
MMDLLKAQFRAGLTTIGISMDHIGYQLCTCRALMRLGKTPPEGVVFSGYGVSFEHFFAPVIGDSAFHVMGEPEHAMRKMQACISAGTTAVVFGEHAHNDPKLQSFPYASTDVLTKLVNLATQRGCWV